jgi:preprotein translocase subunit SecA
MCGSACNPNRWLRNGTGGCGNCSSSASMSEQAALFWRSLPRSSAPNAERADENEGKIDRFLLGAGARIRRPLSGALKRARTVARLVEDAQPAVSGLSEAKLRDAALDMRIALLRNGFTPQLAARAFALVRAAAQRTVGLSHFPVQLMGGHVMLEGMLAEMGTGEGKTLTATLPAATVALAGMPVHVVTVNEYLAKRDAEWMTPVYAALGLSVGIVQPEQPPAERREAYAADICYCTNKDLGFDYLRDTLTLASVRGRGRLLLEKLLERGDRLDRLLLRGLYFAIIDETDSVLIDEARTPLIIAGTQDSAAEEALYRAALQITETLEAEVDFRLDRSERAARLTDAGRERLRELAQSLPPAWRSSRGREELAEQGLSALYLFDLDKHYLIRDGKIQIIDEYTGRVMADRSWERGLQQLIEVKEGCEVTARRSTLARITYQRLFRRYLRLSGMTGTAEEVAPELDAVFGLRSVTIPPNRPVQRVDRGVRLFHSRKEKWQAVARSVIEERAAGRPVLVGTHSVAASEELSAVLAGQGVEHVVLNARQDSEEAGIVACAGIAGRVTVATNMAGRGTDIHLEPEVVASGGLHVILTEFHESRRIDRQLFGRCGRQGDAGSHEAIVSLEDEIFLRHASANTALIAARYAGGSDALPAWTANYLRVLAQQSAERANSHMRKATMELDRKLDTALGFAGRTE